MEFNNQGFESGVKTTLNSLKNLNEKLKMNEGSKGLDNISRAASKVNLNGLGQGVETVKAVESTGLDAGDFEAVRQEAVKRKIGDKELAALILAGNKPGAWGTTLSSTQRDDILKYLKDYPTK